MSRPQYGGKSIVNLMSSLAKGLGGSSPYPLLDHLPPKEILLYKNIILFVIDGLGYDYVMQYGKGTMLQKNLRAKMTTVFPTTTAAAVSTFFTGLAPQQHALTGWYMHLKELGVISTILPFTTKYGGIKGIPLTEEKVNPASILTFISFFDKLKVPSYIMQPRSIAHSATSQIFSGKARKVPYTSATDLSKKLKNIISTDKRRKYVYAYWMDFDSVCHNYGKAHQKARTHFKKLTRWIEQCAKRLEGTNTLMIITADHGQIVTKKSQQIKMSKHPKMKEALVLPLAGDYRTAYCYVKPSKAKNFEK